MASVSAGTVVGGKYRLEEPIGQGGMASVWRATHTTLESTVAVKFLETFGTSREKMAKRFLREARLAGGLKHRNVVHILDFGVMDDGQPFMVMELLVGTSLADRFESGTPMPEAEVFDVVAQVLSGLAAVHDAGIVHRDVKPDNIFLVRDADGDYPKLLDFGISRGVDAQAGDTRVTNTGAVIGTPLYMSPEQARGMNDVDRRTDLWSIGMVLWEGLAGTLPFEAEHMGDVLIRIATEDAPSIATVRPDLPAEAVDVIARALSKDRAARFQDAREMRAAVIAAADVLAAVAGTLRRRPRPSSALSGVAVAEGAATSEMQAPPTMARRARWPLIAGGAVALVALIAVAFIGLGVEIRFSSAEAAPPPEAAPPEPATTTAPAPEPDPRPEPALEPPAEPEPAVEPPPDPARVEPTVAEPAAPEHEESAPARPRNRARPRGTRQRPATAAQPTEQPRPSQHNGSNRPGGFLRDLDY